MTVSGKEDIMSCWAISKRCRKKLPCWKFKIKT